MSGVRFENVQKIYPGGVSGAKDINFEIKDKEFCILVGPSGCGKSTTLRMIAGLEEISDGNLYIGDTVVNDIPPKDRDIAFVFQNYALYPHMTVYENMAFGLKLRGYSKTEIDNRVMDAAKILNIDMLLERKPKALSGGQRQRVAVGRAIVRKPKVFLFDEPLSNLDAKFRVQMRAEIKKLHEKLQTTIVYVTHDQTEAMTMGDRIVVMKDGMIQQIGEPIGLYDNPKNKFVAGFIGSPPMNFMECGVEKKDGGVYLVEEKFRVKLPDDMAQKMEVYVGKRITFGIRPEDIYDKLFLQSSNPDFTVSMVVDVVEPMGSEIFLHLKCGKTTFVGRVDAHNKAKVNQDLEIVLNLKKSHIFDQVTEKTII